MPNTFVIREDRDYCRVLRDQHFEQQNGKCYFCAVEMTPPHSGKRTACTLEHLRARADGGGTNILNTVACCYQCNQVRSKQRKIRIANRQASAGYRRYA